MTTPHVTEISSARLRRMSGPETVAAFTKFRAEHNEAAYIDAYRSRCAEIRALDARADAARSEY